MRAVFRTVRKNAIKRPSLLTVRHLAVLWFCQLLISVGTTAKLGMLISVTWSHDTKYTKVKSMSLYAVYIVCVLSTLGASYDI